MNADGEPESADTIQRIGCGDPALRRGDSATAASATAVTRSESAPRAAHARRVARAVVIRSTSAANSRRSPSTPFRENVPRSSKRTREPCDEIAHRARDQDLAGLGRRRDPRADVNGDAAEVVADELALARVDAGPELDAERAEPRPGSRRRSGSPASGCRRIAKKPSPIVFTSRPRKRSSSRRTRTW